MGYNCANWIYKMAAICTCVIFLILLGFSRVFLGANSYNHVFFGALLGTVFALIGHFNVKPYFLAMPELLLID